MPTVGLMCRYRGVPRFSPKETPTLAPSSPRSIYSPIPIYENNLIQLVRFIDDMFGVFVPNNDINANYIQDHSTIQFQEFVNDLTFGNLEWDDIVYGDSLNFLDLNISIDSTNRIVTKSYQKPLNLYQYIPPHSAHPPHMMRGIIYSLIEGFFHGGNVPSVAVTFFKFDSP